jgi:hypothetical protein
MPKILPSISPTFPPRARRKTHVINGIGTLSGLAAGSLMPLIQSFYVIELNRLLGPAWIWLRGVAPTS